jgi:hypothetical protein
MYRGDTDGLYLTEAPRPYETVVDALDQAEAILEAEQRLAERRRWNPLYWADRSLRAVLGFPAYVISLVFGFDRHSLSTSSERALWWFSLAADAAGIYGFGVLLGWWG